MSAHEATLEALRRATFGLTVCLDCSRELAIGARFCPHCAKCTACGHKTCHSAACEDDARAWREGAELFRRQYRQIGCVVSTALRNAPALRRAG